MPRHRRISRVLSIRCGGLLLACLIACTLHAEETPKPSDVKNPALRSELLARRKVDQDARQAVARWWSKHGVQTEVTLDAELKAEFDKLTETMVQVDSTNTAWFKGIVENQGWPTRSLVGKDGASAAWLLVQHADLVPQFQRQCLDLMTRLPRDEVSQQDVAYLTDRVLVAEGKKQRYGTQFHAVDGKFQPRPLEDEAEVDTLRANVGLPPLAEYAEQMKKLYGGGEGTK